MKANGITPKPTADSCVFALPSVPDPPGSLQLFLNTLLQEPGEEFNLSGNEIHFRNAPHARDRMRAWFEAED